MRSRAAGFTIVELLVVIAIIGTLAGLLLPAVQAARESGRRATCKNHVSQIAKAMIQFETSMGAFPSGGWGNLWLPSPNRGGELRQTGGWTFGILPYMEQMPIRDLIEKATTAADYAAPLAAPMPEFVCPSRRAATPIAPRGVQFKSSVSLTHSLATAARTDFAANGGAGAKCPPLYVLRGISSTATVPFCHDPDAAKTDISLDVTSIVIGGHMADFSDHLDSCSSCDGVVCTDDFSNVSQGEAWAAKNSDKKLQTPPHSYGADFGDGIVYRMSRIVAAKISDGLSNTYLLCEKYVPKDGYNSLQAGDDPLLTGFGSHNVRWAYDQPANDRDDGVTGTGRLLNAMGSAHAGTFTVAYGDGSVQEISTAIDLAVHRKLASRGDGQTVERP